MFDKTILTEEIVKFSEAAIELLGNDLIGVCTDNTFNCNDSSLLDCFMAIINQRYVVELLCVDELFDANNVRRPLTKNEAVYELSILDKGGDIFDFKHVREPLKGAPESGGWVGIYFYGYENSIKVLQELMKLYHADGV